MANKILLKRGTRTQIESAKLSSALTAYEPVVITDEGRIDISMTENQSVTLARLDDISQAGRTGSYNDLSNTPTVTPFWKSRLESDVNSWSARRGLELSTGLENPFTYAEGTLTTVNQHLPFGQYLTAVETEGLPIPVAGVLFVKERWLTQTHQTYYTLVAPYRVFDRWVFLDVDRTFSNASGWVERVSAQSSGLSTTAKGQIRDNIDAQRNLGQVASIELGAYLSGDRTSHIDFHSSDSPTYTDYSARIIREPGDNGNFSFANRGAGQFLFNAPLRIQTSFEMSPASPSGLMLTSDSTLHGTVAPFLVGRDASNSGWAYGGLLGWDRLSQFWMVRGNFEFRPAGGAKSLKVTNMVEDGTNHSIRSSTANLIINAASGGALYLNYDTNGPVLIGPSALNVMALENHTGILAASKSALRPDLFNGIGSFIIGIYTDNPTMTYSLNYGNYSVPGNTIGDTTNTGFRYVSGLWRIVGWIRTDEGGRQVHLFQRIS